MKGVEYRGSNVGDDVTANRENKLTGCCPSCRLISSESMVDWMQDL